MNKLVVLGVLALAACGDQLEVIDGSSCKTDAECLLGGVRGECQSSGFCAYPDDSCADGMRYSPGATGMEGACIGGLACGTSDGAACCGGTTCGANLVCGAEQTCECGAAGEPCCGGSTCDDGFTCSSGTCNGGIASAAFGHSAACVSRVDGTVDCWGFDGRRWAQSIPGAAVSVTPPGRMAISGVAEVARGLTHSCARKTDGTVWCWGHNENGQLGNGSNTSSQVPVQVTGLTGATQIAIGRNHTCAIGMITTPGIFCWGRNGRNSGPTSGRLGNNSGTESNLPVPVDMSAMAPSGQTARHIAAGGYVTCAIMSDDKVWCWGHSDGRGLGDAAATSTSSVPVQVDLTQITTPTPGTPQSLALSHGRAREFSVALRMSGGTIHVWGMGDYSQFGDGTVGDRSRPAAPVTMTSLGAATFTSVVSTDRGFCALASDDKVWCWGQRWMGAVGDGVAVDQGNKDSALASSPVQVMGLPASITSIHAGHHAACAIDDAKKLWCWGNNRRGHLTRQPVNTLANAQLLIATDVTP